MNRPPSPIRHDYKPSGTSEARSPNALPWFAAGLGLPLVIVALFLTVGNDPVAEVTELAEQPVAVAETETPPATPAELEPAADPLPDASADASADASTAIEVDAEDVIELAAVVDSPDPEFHPPLALPPEYPKVELTIRRGDTLDRLFRRNDLDLGDLAAIVRLPDAAPHLKKLIPGDELTIEHDDGRLVSLYREIDLTNALLIERSDDGFSTSSVVKPSSPVLLTTCLSVDKSS